MNWRDQKIVNIYPIINRTLDVDEKEGGIFSAGIDWGTWVSRIEAHAESGAEAVALRDFVLEAILEKIARDTKL